MTDLMMTSAAEFRIGRVFSRSFELLFRDFAKFVLLGGIAWLPFLLLALVGFGAAATGRQPGSGGFATIAVAAVGSIVLFLALQILSQAVVLYGTFQVMRGQSFAIGESLSRGLARFLPILGMFVIIGLATGLAAILLLFPAFISVSYTHLTLPTILRV